MAIGTTVTVVGQHQIQSQKIEQAGEVLRQVPGVIVTQSGSPGTVTDVSICGATPAQTLLMLDGVEVNSGATGSFDRIPPTQAPAPFVLGVVPK